MLTPYLGSNKCTHIYTVSGMLLKKDKPLKMFFFGGGTKFTKHIQRRKEDIEKASLKVTS